MAILGHMWLQVTGWTLPLAREGRETQTRELCQKVTVLTVKALLGCQLVYLE